MRILIIEDHKCVSDGLQRIIQCSDIEAVTDAANSVNEAREKLFTSKPLITSESEHNKEIDMMPQNIIDVVILDIHLPDGDGLEFCKEIKTSYPDIGVIMLTSFANLAVIAKAKDYGADGYIIKNADADEIIDGIKTVYNGQKFLCKEARTIYQRCSVPQQATLTPREKQIVKLIIEGYSMKEIAEKLFLGFETIRTYQKYIHAKLDIHNMAQLIKKATDERLV